MLLAACQGTRYSEPTTALNQTDHNCYQVVTDFRTQVADAQAGYASARPILGFPLIHMNRFLAGVAEDIDSQEQLSDWLDFAMPVSLQARHSENANLPAPWSEAELTTLADCNRLAANDPNYRVALLSQLQGKSHIGNHYLSSRKWLGAYALMRPFYLRSIKSLHLEEKQWFDQPEKFVNTLRYQAAQTQISPASELVSDWFAKALSNNSLAIPKLEDEELLRLFQLHAPELEIEYQGTQDLLGSPYWRRGRLALDTDSPQTYLLPSYTNFAGRKLLQLNYVFWFSERQSRGLIDLYSGHFDGIIWRVTLDQEGQVLLYDSIHPCGCYHKYFVVSDKVKILDDARSSEPANIFRLGGLNASYPVKVSLTSNEHFIVGLSNTLTKPEPASLGSTRKYGLNTYASLAELNDSGRSKTMFDESGLVFDSDRLERFTLWPTGIISVGAMRQWGTHATGFIEEQQFDDYKLLDLYFDYDD